MTRLTLYTAIAQLICGLILAGLSIYYCVIADYTKFAVFSVVGLSFIALPIRTFFLYRKQRKAEEEREKSEHKNRGNFI